MRIPYRTTLLTVTLAGYKNCDDIKAMLKLKSGITVRLKKWTHY